MCGRFVLNVDPAALMTTFDVGTVPDFAPRFNVAPTQDLPVILNEQPRQAAALRWGLIPSWAKDAGMGSKMINARAETVDEKPAFRAAFKRRRCIIPASGFYEWQVRDDGKQPMYITVSDTPLFGMAGLWEVWRDADDQEVRTFTILTTDANEFMQKIHHRMPVILRPQDYETWLQTGDVPAPELKSLLKPYDAGEMDAHAVTKAVNRPVVDIPNLILPIE